MFLVEQMKGKLDNMKFSNIKKIRKEFNLTQKERNEGAVKKEQNRCN